MKFFLGLDIGGTKTDCALADENRILSRAKSGSTKILRQAKADAAVALRDVLDTVSRESGVALADVTASCIGTSGAAVADVTNWLSQQMKMRVGGLLQIVGDEVITLDAAFPGGAGIIVIAGTGSNVIGRNRNGWTTTAGGWGPELADEGSGSRLGRQTLRGIFAAINAGEDPPLLHRVLNHLGLHTRDELIASANALGFQFASLMPLIVEAARDGDAVARSTLQEGGEELAGLALHVIRKLAVTEPGIENGLKVATTGSIVTHVEEVTDAMRQNVLAVYPRIEFVPGTVDPVEGALWHARRLGQQNSSN